jgi:predicted acylesterase/phospholipase RssA
MNENSPIYKTRFYSDCIGVFQGGGCRAAAFGGAYDAAFKLGVRFSEVAGTSAGSIVAALLAAGADPTFLLAKLEKLDFPSLLVKPTRSTFSTGSKLVSLLQIVPFKSEGLNSIVGIARLGGLHSSAGIETWVETCLKELTGKQNGPVLFSDLVIPLHVVAGDLSTMKSRVWSTRTTANQSVAHAVRASCTIPLFFQPVEEGSALLVDGGIVSNIPHFLFAGASAQNAKGRKRLLLFMLEASEERKRADDAKELLSQLASLAIDGGTDVQLSFTPDIARIVIPTGNIHATDFNEMDETKVAMLIANGRCAAETFITGELLSTQGSPAESSSISDEHEAFLTICEQLYSTRSSVRVAIPDTKWFWELFPTVLHWRKTNIRIVAFVPPVAANSQDEAKETQRRGFMTGMGVELVEKPALPFHGMLFDTVASSGAGALTFPGERTDYEPAGRFYSGRIDQAAIAALHERLQLPIAPAANSQHRPLLQPADQTVLLARLRENVQFYREPGVTLTIEEVDLSKVFLISRYVRAFRYKQIQSFVAHYKEQGLELFTPAQVPLHGGGFSLVTPPVVEETNSKFVALEGNTRFLYCFNNGISKIKAVVVRGVKAELPGKPVPLKQVRITTIKHPPGERMVGYNHGLFRDIERAVRPLPAV